jgi:hypothetical protein
MIEEVLKELNLFYFVYDKKENIIKPKNGGGVVLK